MRSRTSGLRDAEHFAVLMQRVGFALWQLQELENAAASYIVVRLRASRGVGMERGRELSAEADRQPLGNLVGELVKAEVLAPDLASRLQALLRERNWLVHRSKRESHGLLVDQDLYARLSARLDRIAADALALTKELASEMEAYVIDSGVSRDFVDRESERLARSWGLLEEDA